MVFVNENDVIREIQIRCDCGDGIIELTQFKEDKYVCMGYKTDAFYAYYKPTWQGVKRAIGIAWYALTGKSYRLFDIVLSEKDVKQLKQAINILEE